MHMCIQLWWEENFFFEKGYKLVALEHWARRWLVILCGFTEALLWLVEVQSIWWLKVGHSTYKSECIGRGFLQCEKFKLQGKAEELSLLLHLYIFQVVFQCLQEWENEHKRVMICTRRWLRVVLSSLERSRCTTLLCILKLGSLDKQHACHVDPLVSNRFHVCFVCTKFLRDQSCCLASKSHLV